MAGKKKEAYLIPQQDYQVRVILRKKQRYIRLRIIDRNEVILSGPAGTGKKEIRRALEEKKEWIEKHIQLIAKQQEAADPRQHICYQGNTYKIGPPGVNRLTPQISGSNTKTPGIGPDLELGIEIDTEKKEIIIHNTTEKEITELLETWLRNEARRIIPNEVFLLARKFDIPIKNVYIRNQRTRWGSSSGKKNISINWRIITAPPAVRHYLIIHELAHQYHFNHSKAYWEKLSKMYPDYKKAEKWLKQNHSLMLLFR